MILPQTPQMKLVCGFILRLNIQGKVHVRKQTICKQPVARTIKKETRNSSLAYSVTLLLAWLLEGPLEHGCFRTLHLTQHHVGSRNMQLPVKSGSHG